MPCFSENGTQVHVPLSRNIGDTVMAMKKAVVIGGGASGMLCAAIAAQNGLSVTLMEQNEKLGKKLYITGKGRCNFTNVCDTKEFLDHVVSNPRFLYSAAQAAPPDDILSLFKSWGLEYKIERGRRAFPASDRAADVTDMLKRQLKKAQVQVLLNTKVTEIRTEDGQISGVCFLKDEAAHELDCDIAVLATGGISYPSTGSTGDGYRFAASLGHTVTPLYPSLVPLCCEDESVRKMQGLSLKNVEFHIKEGRKEIYSGFGEMMFTHFGITGPLVLTASAMAGPLIGQKELYSYIDLKPAVSTEMLDARLVKLFFENSNRILKNVLPDLYPGKMQAVIPQLADVDPNKKLHEITKEERRRIIQVTKEFPVHLTALRGYNEAVVTKGGVDVREVTPSTMESKLVRGLYFTGELLDLDACTGGYNLQIAWSTAVCAARAMAAS